VGITMALRPTGR